MNLFGFVVMFFFCWDGRWRDDNFMISSFVDIEDEE
jgi:hypothetical protein